MQILARLLVYRHFLFRDAHLSALGQLAGGRKLSYIHEIRCVFSINPYFPVITKSSNTSLFMKMARIISRDRRLHQSLLCLKDLQEYILAASSNELLKRNFTYRPQSLEPCDWVTVWVRALYGECLIWTLNKQIIARHRCLSRKFSFKRMQIWGSYLILKL